MVEIFNNMFKLITNRKLTSTGVDISVGFLINDIVINEIMGVIFKFIDSGYLLSVDI